MVLLTSCVNPVCGVYDMVLHDLYEHLRGLPKLFVPDVDLMLVWLCYVSTRVSTGILTCLIEVAVYYRGSHFVNVSST